MDTYLMINTTHIELSPALQYCTMTTCLSHASNTASDLSKNDVFIVAGAQNICRCRIVFLGLVSALRGGFRLTPCLHLGICCSSISLFLVRNLSFVRRIAMNRIMPKPAFFSL